MLAETSGGTKILFMIQPPQDLAMGQSVPKDFFCKLRTIILCASLPQHPTPLPDYAAHTLSIHATKQPRDL
jgi:hypothetical protein